jgi:hypothetical protein
LDEVLWEEEEMSKVPYVERAYLGTGLTGECAYLWACFLANEADMADDTFAYAKWKSMADDLAPKQGKPTPAAVHFSDLEDAIKKYNVVEYVYPGSDPQE